MTDQFLAEIRIFGFNFPPKGWAQCNGQLMPLSQNTALFALLGTMYGGDGKSTFALPDLAGAVPVAAGVASGLSPRTTGEVGGSSTVTLLESEMPAHVHSQAAMASFGASNDPATRLLARPFGGGFLYAPGSGGSLVSLDQGAVALAGADHPHNNLMPYLPVNFCIALQGIFPQRP